MIFRAQDLDILYPAKSLLQMLQKHPLMKILRLSPSLNSGICELPKEERSNTKDQDCHDCADWLECNEQSKESGRHENVRRDNQNRIEYSCHN